MTAAPIALEIAGTQEFRDELTPRLVVVLVAPAGTLSQCSAAIQKTVLAGAVTVACEVDAEKFDAAVVTVLGTVDDALSRYPALPVVLVGHGAAADLTSLAAEAYGDDLAGLVLTHQHANPGPTRRAA